MHHSDQSRKRKRRHLPNPVLRMRNRSVSVASLTLPALIESNREFKAHRRTAGRGRGDPPPARGEPDPSSTGWHHRSEGVRGDSELVRAVPQRAGKPRLDARRSSRAYEDRRAGTFPVGNGENAEPDADDAPQIGSGIGPEAGSGVVGGVKVDTKRDLLPFNEKCKVGAERRPTSFEKFIGDVLAHQPLAQEDTAEHGIIYSRAKTRRPILDDDA